ncbi:MAG: hypothetical protein GYB65_15145, partial [Chloroflexi bacterium]|nr:hypothetical protein [Chloroflexota bacterium]
MRISRSRLVFAGVIGLAVLFVGGTLLVNNLNLDGDDDVEVITGFIGSEKADFLDNPEV